MNLRALNDRALLDRLNRVEATINRTEAKIDKLSLEKCKIEGEQGRREAEKRIRMRKTLGHDDDDLDRAEYIEEMSLGGRPYRGG